MRWEAKNHVHSDDYQYRRNHLIKVDHHQSVRAFTIELKISRKSFMSAMHPPFAYLLQKLMFGWASTTRVMKQTVSRLLSGPAQLVSQNQLYLGFYLRYTIHRALV